LVISKKNLDSEERKERFVTGEKKRFTLKGRYPFVKEGRDRGGNRAGHQLRSNKGKKTLTLCRAGEPTLLKHLNGKSLEGQREGRRTVRALLGSIQGSSVKLGRYDTKGGESLGGAFVQGRILGL